MCEEPAYVYLVSESQIAYLPEVIMRHVVTDRNFKKAGLGIFKVLFLYATFAENISPR
jgi:hypothetical protein